MASLEDFKEIHGFNSCRDEVVERKKIGRILEAGRHAPSPGKRQTLEFVVIESEEVREHLSSILGDHRIEDAPVSVVILADPERMARRVKKPLEACYAEAAGAAQNMRIMASSEDLCSNLATGFDSDSVGDLIGAPSQKEAIAVVTMAYSDHPVEGTDRFGLNEICFYDEYGAQIQSVFDNMEWSGLRNEKSKYGKKGRGLVKKLRDKL